MTPDEQRTLKRKLDKAIAALVNQQRALERISDANEFLRADELADAYRMLGDALRELRDARGESRGDT